MQLSYWQRNMQY